ncbi:MAG: hypothetical protein AAF409_15020 [Pseudomonadota bacterium]
MLDTVDKVSKILFSVVGTFCIAVATYEVEWTRLGLETDGFCLEHAQTYEAMLLQYRETPPPVVVDRYAERCGVSEDEAFSDLKTIQAIVIQQAQTAVSAGQVGQVSSAEDLLSGFVAVGSAEPSVFRDVNFDVAGDGSPAIQDGAAPDIGTVLVARWGVNLRTNLLLTTSGKNPSKTVIPPGGCVRIIGAPEVRGTKYWAKVELLDCPG